MYLDSQSIVIITVII